jgi:ATP-dependent DNA helicase RecG
MPTSVLLSIYGGGAITTLPQLPSRGAETVVVPSDQREIAYGAAREAIALGQQVIIVLPLRRGQDLLSLAEARRLAEELSTGFLDKARINIFHGAMSREERFRAYDDFQHRRADALLATTFLEHGPVVPNASVLIVESAEHFDGIRLHRLRGLVTHGWWRGRCLLISAAPDSPAVELVASETDGYKIATMELKRLGIEATTGERPGEVVEFFWGDPGGDRELFTRTRQEAFKLLTQDPGLKKRSSRSLAWLVRARLGEEPESESKPERSEGRDARSESRNASKRRRRRK